MGLRITRQNTTKTDKEKRPEIPGVNRLKHLIHWITRQFSSQTVLYYLLNEFAL